ncbi:MAG: imidazole glycerol phosphate synthase subunit HisH [Paenisporosarcina sp.]
MKIGVIDYGMGNLYSVEQALLRLGCNVTVTSDTRILDEMDGLVLPGVGAFPDAMNILKTKGVDRYIQRLSETNKPLLGICLGMQLLFEESEENGITKGLGLLKGRIRHFQDVSTSSDVIRVPHMGWNPLSFTHYPDWLQQVDKQNSTHVYFVHSYLATQTSRDEIIASATYAGEFVPGLVQKNNLTGMQFHPEKSGPFGKYLLYQWVRAVEEREFER